MEGVSETDLFLRNGGKLRQLYRAELVLRLNSVTKQAFVVKSRFVTMNKPSHVDGPAFDILWMHSSIWHKELPEVRWFVKEK
jgi:hypothetical protein